MEPVSKRVRATAVLIAVAFCMLVAAQSIRPITTFELEEIPGAASLHQRLTRCTLEEVGGQELDLSGQSESPASVPNPVEYKHSVSRPDRSAETRFPYRWFHRKVLPPSPDDYN